MAKPEQTEKPTAKRRSEAKQKGQIAKSQDLASSAVFLTVIIALHAGFHATLDSASTSFAFAMIHMTEHEQSLSVRDAMGLFLQDGAPFGPIIAFAFLSAMVIGIVANVAQVGFILNLNRIAPKFSKLNPLAGLKTLFFSPQTLVNLAKQLLKLAAVVTIVLYVLHDKVSLFYALAHRPPRELALTVEGLLYEIGIRFGVVLFILALLDFAWERKRNEDSLKMSKTEIKDEAKQQEGSVEAKGAIRSRRMAARRRMMSMVPKATVVVTNPTHVAVALMWDDLAMDAPIVVAKGADLIARRIRQVATEHNVPIMENPPLARTIYNTVPIDTPIPPDLYAAVAQVIAFVFKLKNKTIA